MAEIAGCDRTLSCEAMMHWSNCETNPKLRTAQRIAQLEEALRRADRTCEHMHHDKNERHVGSDCPVEKWVNAVLKEEE